MGIYDFGFTNYEVGGAVRRWISAGSRIVPWRVGVLRESKSRRKDGNHGDGGWVQFHLKAHEEVQQNLPRYFGHGLKAHPIPKAGGGYCDFGRANA